MVNWNETTTNGNNMFTCSKHLKQIRWLIGIEFCGFEFSMEWSFLCFRGVTENESV